MKEQKIKQAFDSVALTQQEKDALLQNILSASGHRPAERKRIMKYRKTLLIAAIITAMAIFMGCAVAETTGLYSLIIALILLFVNPFTGLF